MIFPDRLYTRHLIYYKNQVVKSDHDWNLPRPLDPASIQELQCSKTTSRNGTNARCWLLPWLKQSIWTPATQNWANNKRMVTGPSVCYSIHQLARTQGCTEDVRSSEEHYNFDPYQQHYEPFLHQQRGRNSFFSINGLATEFWNWWLNIWWLSRVCRKRS